MASQIVKRRANIIARHLASIEDGSPTEPHVFPMRCSNHLNPVIRRFDNITYFARQGSGYQGSFMRQASTTEQVNCIQPGTHTKSSSFGEMQPNATDAPAFACPAEVKPGTPTVKGIQSVVEGYQYSETTLEAPIFARPCGNCEHSQVQYKENTVNFKSKELEWSPKMDVVESGFNYVVALEIPGIGGDSIKVEVNNQSLIVTGNRCNWSCEAAGSNRLDSFYHRREISQGPYQVVWQLPTNANKESISAEIQDGLLRVIIPKLSALRWLRKTHM